MLQTEVICSAIDLNQNGMKKVVKCSWPAL